MKWIIKGHEYDDTFKYMDSLDGIYLFGAGHDGKLVYSILCERYPVSNILGFVDNDKTKIGTSYCGEKVFNINDLESKKNVGIVVSFSSEYTKEINQQLEGNGWKRGINYWHYEEFISVYAAYKYDEVFFSSICILPTTFCNLRCKSCLNFTNYIKNFENRPIERLKAEVDQYFKTVDYTGLFFISGGEPLLYPDLPELIKYISDNFRSQFYEYGIVTNGTIKPSRELLDTLDDTSIIITVDDYREMLPEKKELIESNIALFESLAQLKKSVVRKYDMWISLYPHEIKEVGEDRLIEKYNRCHCPWQEYKGGRLYSCNYASFADTANICDAELETETFNLYEYTDDKIKELIEFRLGYTKKGYVEFCKKCAGYMDINPYRVSAAEQE